VQDPVDTTLIVVVEFGTSTEVYPDISEDLATPDSKAVTYPSTLEYKSNGPVPDPAVVKVISTVIILSFYFLTCL
jgi:hypothetical protein